jgi:hypothetical protein
MRRLLSLIAFGIVITGLGQAQLSVQVKGTTATQAVLSYTAPDANPCAIKVSESTSLSPLVHDVDAALFANSDSDSRPGVLSHGTSRLFVVGTRDTETGTDGSNYSRALQANTLHYYSITCGASVVTGSFTTANVPLGMTYRDLPASVFPTVTDDLAQTIVDPHTGTLLKKLNNSTAFPSGYDPYLYFGGFTRMCATKPSGPDGGFLCAFPTRDGGPSVLFYVTPSGGSNYLGYVTIQPQDGADGWAFMFSFAYPYVSQDGSLYTVSGDNSGHVVLLKGVFVGGYTPVTGAYQSAVEWHNITPGSSRMDINTQVQAFDPAFNPGLYKWPQLSPPVGNYIMFAFTRGDQDTPGWYAVMDLTTAKIVAAINLESGPVTSYCGMHNSQVVGDKPLVSLGTHGLWGGTNWQGPFMTTLAVRVDADATTIKIAGAPVDAKGNTLGGPFVGSILTLHGEYGTEPVKVTAVDGPTLKVQRNYVPHLASWDNLADYHPLTHAAGETVRAECTDWTWSGDTPMYWAFLDDPHGSKMGTGVMYDWGLYGLGGHNDWGADVEVVEGWGIRTGNLLKQIGQPQTYALSDSPTFATAQGGCFGSGCAKHPSYHTPGAQWFTDGTSWSGGQYTYPDPDAVTPVSGQLYQYRFPYDDGNFAFALRQLHRKIVPTLATTGGNQLVDVSGPGSVISDQPVDTNKYCVAYLSGECRAGSSVGDIFVNVAALDRRTCYGSDNPDPSVKDVCILDLPTYASSMVQVGFVPNHEGMGLFPGQTDTLDSGTIGAGYSRTVSEALSGPKGTGMLFKSLPDGSWSLFENRTGPATSYVMMAKMPPFTKDSVRRDVFVPAPISITPPTGQGIVSAGIEFGYVELGGYCTSRREACVAVSSTVDNTNPFNYAQSDAYSKAPCSPSCTIALPVLPQHTAYYQVKYYDSDGKFVSNGDRGVVVESAVANLATVPAPLLPNALAAAKTAFETWYANQTPENFTALIVGCQMHKRGIRA